MFGNLKISKQNDIKKRIFVKNFTLERKTQNYIISIVLYI